MQRRQYIVIPVEIWENPDLTKMEMLLYAEIDSFSRQGECFASNAHFADYLSVNKDRISKMLTSLRRKGFIEIELIYKEGTKQIEKRIIRPIPIGQMDVPPRSNGRTPLGEMDEPPLGHMAEGINTYLLKEQYKDTKEELNNIEQNSPQYEREFEKIWKAYPRKMGKKKAFDAFKKARKIKKIPYETIEKGLYKYIEYLEQQQTEERFIMHGSTWFTQEKWQDEYVSIAPKRKPRNAFEFYQMEYGGRSHEPSGNGEIINDYSAVIPEPL
jgi:hypothetical protein